MLLAEDDVALGALGRRARRGPSGAAVEGCLSRQLATLRMSRMIRDKLTPGMPEGSLEVVQLRKTTQAPPRRKIFSHIALAALRDGAGARIW